MYEVFAIALIVAGVRKLFVANGPVLLKLKSNEGAKRVESLCGTCAYSLVRKNGNGEKLTSCNYGGNLAAVSFVVLDCSGYFDNRVEYPEKIAGFIKPGSRLPGKVTVINIPRKARTN